MDPSISTNIAGLITDLRALVQQATATTSQIGNAAASVAQSVTAIQADVHSIEQYIQQHGLHIL